MDNVFVITKASTFINDRKNFIQFSLNKKFINYSFSTSKQHQTLVFPFGKEMEKFFGVSLLEIELLVNLSLTPVLFQPGEVLPNGNVAKQNNHRYYIKNWKILSENSLDKIRVVNEASLLKFERIRNVSVLKTYDNLIHIYVEDKKEPYLYTIKELIKISGLQINEFNLLVSSYISPICYVENEVSNVTGWIIPKNSNYNNTIIKEINLRVPLFNN